MASDTFRLIFSDTKPLLISYATLHIGGASRIVRDPPADEREPIIGLIPIPKRLAPRNARDSRKRSAELHTQIQLHPDPYVMGLTTT